MIDKICMFLTNKMREQMPDIDDEKAEVINYGLQNIIGEIPKAFILLGIAYLLGVFKLTIITFLLLLPYRWSSGGVHLKTHIGCIVLTAIMYCVPAFFSKIIVWNELAKFIFIICEWIFGIIMIRLYAPADTENVPILREKERKMKKKASYFILTVALLIAAFIQNQVISNILIFSYLIQTFMITKAIYQLTKNQYGYEVYQNASVTN